MKPQSIKIPVDFGRADSADVPWILLGSFIAAAVILTLPSFAFAAGNDTRMGNVLCNATTWTTGNLGKGLATVGVGIIAFKAMQGAVTWGMTSLAGAGIACIFSASPLVHAINPSVDMSNCDGRRITLPAVYVASLGTGGGPRRTPTRPTGRLPIIVLPPI